MTCNLKFYMIREREKDIFSFFFFTWQQHAGAIRGEQMGCKETEMDTAGQE